jgi:hypothetical protein
LLAALKFFAILNEPVDFLAQVGFFTPKVFRILAAVELAAFALANATQTSSPSQCCRFAPLGFPKMLKACFG